MVVDDERSVDGHDLFAIDVHAASSGDNASGLQFSSYGPSSTIPPSFNDYRSNEFLTTTPNSWTGDLVSLYLEPSSWSPKSLCFGPCCSRFSAAR